MKIRRNTAPGFIRLDPEMLFLTTFIISIICEGCVLYNILPVQVLNIYENHLPAINLYHLPKIRTITISLPIREQQSQTQYFCRQAAALGKSADQMLNNSHLQPSCINFRPSLFVATYIVKECRKS